MSEKKQATRGTYSVQHEAGAMNRKERRGKATLGRRRDKALNKLIEKLSSSGGVK